MLCLPPLPLSAMWVPVCTGRICECQCTLSSVLMVWLAGGLHRVRLPV